MKQAAAVMALALGMSAGPALAQEPGEDAVRESFGDARGFERADRPPTPPPPPEAPRAAEAREPDGGRFYGPGGRGGYDRRDGGDGDRGDRDRGDRADGGRDRDRADRDRKDRDERRRDWRHDDRRRWNNDRWWDDRRYWSWGRWPGVYDSPYRYRHAWRPPSGYYVRDWAFGDHLPRGWYGASWWIDPWAFRLPLPPPGFGWVRSGDDALLVDRYTGRVVQVVRDVFW